MTILLVDDNADYLMLLKDELFEHGYTVHTAEDGEVGCDVLSKHDIDLIISDIRMPRLDGLKLHAFVREMDKYRQTVFIFVSGFKDIYKEYLKLDPNLDFFFDKTTGVDEIVKFVDNLMFGNFSTMWKPRDKAS